MVVEKSTVISPPITSWSRTKRWSHCLQQTMSTDDNEVRENTVGNDDVDTGKKMAVKDRLFKLKLQYNAGRKANTKQVEQEYHNYSGKKGSSDEIIDNSSDDEKNEEDNNNSNSNSASNNTRSIAKFKKDKSHHQMMNMTAKDSEVKKDKESELKFRKSTFGMNSLTADHDYNAYLKGIDINISSGVSAKSNSDVIDEFSYGTTNGASKSGLDKLTNDIKRKEEMRAKSIEKRNRLSFASSTVDSINDKNALFNKRVKKSFDKYTVEIRQNLERGTAL